MRRALKIGGGLLGLILLVGVVSAIQVLPVYSGLTAKLLCTSTWVLEDENARSWRTEKSPWIWGLLSVFRPRLKEQENRSVESDFLGFFSRKARFESDRGCVLEREAEAAPKISDLPSLSALRPSDSWPVGEHLVVADNDVERAVDERIRRFAQDSMQPLDTQSPTPLFNSNVLIVVRQDRLVAEVYAPGFDEKRRVHGWSMTKSVVNSLIGLMVKDGLLTLDQTELFSEWSGDSRSKINVKNLLQMQSGLAPNETHDFWPKSSFPLFGNHEQQGLDINAAQQNQPGAAWLYSDQDSRRLTWLIHRTFDENPRRTYQYMAEKLLNPLSVHSLIFESNEQGVLGGGWQAYMTARDWARFGWFWLQEGRSQGEQLLPPGWMKFSTTPAVHSNQRYGAHFWINRKAADGSQFYPGLPESAFFANGTFGQRMVMLQEQQLVIIRFGDPRNFAKFSFATFVKDILEIVER